MADGPHSISSVINYFSLSLTRVFGTNTAGCKIMIALAGTLQQQSFSQVSLLLFFDSHVLSGPSLVCFVFTLFVCEFLRYLEIEIFQGCQEFPQYFLQDLLSYLSTYTCRLIQAFLRFMLLMQHKNVYSKTLKNDHLMSKP